jgi:hypothetical protein
MSFIHQQRASNYSPGVFWSNFRTNLHILSVGYEKTYQQLVVNGGGYASLSFALCASLMVIGVGGWWVVFNLHGRFQLLSQVGRSSRVVYW